MGKKRRKADSISEEEEQQMWAMNVLGNDSVKSLNHIVLYLLIQWFSIQGCQEDHQLRVQDFNFVNDTSRKLKYAEWVEGLTKT